MLEAYPLLLSLVLYPLLEELIFRWGLLGWLDDRGVLKSKLITNVIVSALFSAAHLAFSGLVHALLVFFPSMALGFIWQRHRSLGLCIAMHSLLNLFFYATRPYSLVSSGTHFWVRFFGLW